MRPSWCDKCKFRRGSNIYCDNCMRGNEYIKEGFSDEDRGKRYFNFVNKVCLVTVTDLIGVLATDFNCDEGLLWDFFIYNGEQDYWFVEKLSCSIHIKDEDATDLEKKIYGKIFEYIETGLLPERFVLVD